MHEVASMNSGNAPETSLVWLRHDLRLEDNPLFALPLSRRPHQMLVMYVFDRRWLTPSDGLPRLGPARLRLLWQSLMNLRGMLLRRGSDLLVRVGDPVEEVLTQVAQHDVQCLEVSRAAADQTDYRALAAVGVKAISSRHGVTPAELVLLSGSSIPKTSSGKIQRADAKRLYQEGKLVPAHLWQAASKTKAVQAGPAFDSAADHLDFYDQLYGDLQQWVADKLDIDPHHIDLDVTFSELGVDSVEAVELVDRLQDRIGRVIPAIELLRYPTVQALIQHFADELEEQALQSAKTVDLEIES